MSVLTLRPNGDSTPLQQQIITSGSHYSNVDEATLSENDYCASNHSITGSYTDIYSFPDHTSESGTINSVTVKLKAKRSQFNEDATILYVNPALKIGSTVYSSGDQTLTGSTAEYTYTWSTNPATSSAWGSDWAVIDAILAGDTMTSHYTNSKNDCSGWCFQFWVEVDYTAGGGSPVFLPNIMKHNFIPPLIGGY